LRLSKSCCDFLFDRGERACAGRKRVGEHVDDVESGSTGGVEALPLRIND
jgi:hypothetical protein